MRFIENTPNGPVLIEAAGDNVSSVGATEKIKLNISDDGWADLHRHLKTGKLNFDTVKKNYKRNSSK